MIVDDGFGEMSHSSLHMLEQRRIVNEIAWLLSPSTWGINTEPNLISTGLIKRVTHAVVLNYVLRFLCASRKHVQLEENYNLIASHHT